MDNDIFTLEALQEVIDKISGLNGFRKEVSFYGSLTGLYDTFGEQCLIDGEYEGNPIIVSDQEYLKIDDNKIFIVENPDRTNPIKLGYE